MNPLEGSVKTIRGIAASHPEIRALYIFGSQSTGRAGPGSDLDLGVLYTTPRPLAETLLLEQAFERAAGRKVDLVDVAHASAFLALDIVRGDRIFCREPAEADRFELYVMGRAGDLLPFERQRRALLIGANPDQSE